MREQSKRSLSIDFENISELSVPKDPLDLVISYKYSIIIVSCLGGDHSREAMKDDAIIVLDLNSRKLIGYIENNIKTLCLCLETNYDGNQNEALLYAKNKYLVKYDLKTLLDQTKYLDADSTNVNTLPPIWTSERMRNAFGMCVDYGNNSISKKASIDDRKLYVCEDEEIIIYSAHNGQEITKVEVRDAWGVRLTSSGDLIYSLFYSGYLDLIKRANLEQLNFEKSFQYTIEDDVPSIYAGGIAIDPINGNIVAILHSIIVLFSPDGRELKRCKVRNAQGCILDEKSGTLFVAFNGAKTIGIFK